MTIKQNSFVYHKLMIFIPKSYPMTAIEFQNNLINLQDSLMGFAYRLTADKLNLNIGTVKSRISLSRRQLMDQLNR